MVALDQDRVIGTLEIVSRLFRRMDNQQELPIIGVIVRFGGRALSIVEAEWAKNHKSVGLVMDCGDCDATCIGLQNDRFWQVETLVDQYFGKTLFELLKCYFGVLGPFPLP